MFMRRRLYSVLLAAFALVAIIVFSGAFSHSVVQAAPPVQINFQPYQDASGVLPVPAGYLRDSGDAYGARSGANQGSGETYGWILQSSVGNPGGGTPQASSGEARIRNRAGIPLELDTIMHMQRPGGIPDIAWEYAIANGTYSVTVSVGDQPAYDSTNRINVEGVNAIAGFVGSAGAEFGQATVIVTVSDGRLTIDAIGGTNTKINYVHIVPVVDTDGDGIPDASDNCPAVANPGQENNYGGPAGDACDDSDGDGFMDNVDACPVQAGVAPNGCPLPDADGDGIPDASDNCPAVANPGQENNYGGPAGDACDDSDSDGFMDNVDACPLAAGVAPDGCPPPIVDTDGDGIPDVSDNCPLVANPGQENNYGGPAGDACDDTDNDGFMDNVDACPVVAGVAPNGCPPPAPNDADGDGIPDVSDNCPTVANPGQENNYGGPAGDACDDSDSDGFMDNIDACPLLSGIAPNGCPAVNGSAPLAPAALPPDERLNWHLGDLEAVLYPAQGPDGGPAIHIYCVDDQSRGHFSFSVSSMDLLNVPEDATGNVEIARSSTCPVAFYLLSTGEFQVNIGPNNNNVVRVLIFNGFDGSGMYTYHFIDTSGGPAAPAQFNGGATRSLTGCRATTTNIVNMRATPSLQGAVLTLVPFNLTLEAINASGDWINIIFGDQNGWVFRDFLTLRGTC